MLEKPRTKRKGLARKPKISAKWCKLFSLIPGYDPIATAAPGDWFDEDAAQRVIDFFPECLKHVKGPKAGEHFVLEDWQQAVTGCLFGWKRPDDTRRYRECLIYVAKKNGKSAWVAGLILYMLVCDGELGAEIYSAAASKDQAALIFSHAAGMVKLDDDLSKLLNVYGAKGGSVVRSIVYDDYMSSYRCLSADADTADGANPHMVAIDEVHRHRTPELAEVLQKSTAARAQPLVVYTTTADYNRISLCNSLLKYGHDVQNNNGDKSKPGYDPGFLPVIYECFRKDDWKSPKTWAKANPNMDVTIPESFLGRECKKAQDDPSKLNNFLRLHLNIVTDVDEAWIPADDWFKASGLNNGETPKEWRTRKLKELAGRKCYVGMDLSAKEDLTAVVLIFPPENEDEKWVLIPYFWIPEDTAAKTERKYAIPYRHWHRTGYVDYTEGNEVDQQAIRKKLNELRETYPIIEIGYDEWNALELGRQLREEDGFEMVVVRQGSRSLSDPAKTLRAKIYSKTIEHGGNPVLHEHNTHTVMKVDENGNIQPSKKKSTGKIDGMVATITGLARALLRGEQKKPVYGIESI